jgi:trimeric autotransporter adhesin
VETTGGDIGPSLGLLHGGAGGKEYRIFSTGAGNGPGAGTLEFYDATADATRMTIASNGNIGIDTAAPREKIEIAHGGHSFHAGGSLVYGMNNYYDPVDARGEFGGMWGGSYYAGAIDFSPTAGSLTMKTSTAAGAENTPVTWNSGLVLLSNGYVGIGLSPTYRLELPNTATAAGQGRANAWQTYSDGRFKTNVKPIESALDKIMALQGVTYTSTTEKNPATQVGFIAQDVEKVVPVVVSVSKTQVTLPDGTTQDVPDYRSMAYDRLVPVLTEAIKELKAANDNLRADFETYKTSHPDDE